MTFPFGSAVTLIRRAVTGVDVDGNDVYGAVPTAVRDCAVWPLQSTETENVGDTIITGLNVLLPPGTAVTAVDVVQVSGADYAVQGEPAHYANPFIGDSPGVLVQLKRVTG